MSLETISPHEQYAQEFDEANKGKAFEEANKNFFEAGNELQRLMKEHNLSTEQLARPENLNLSAEQLTELQDAHKAYQEASEARDKSAQE